MWVCVCPTRIKMLEQTMDRQKLSRMMDRSERMYLWDKGGRQNKVPVSAIDPPGGGATLPPEHSYLHNTA